MSEALHDHVHRAMAAERINRGDDFCSGREMMRSVDWDDPRNLEPDPDQSQSTFREMIRLAGRGRPQESRSRSSMLEETWGMGI